jgi:DNA-binding GntR family transcriptional regulator
LSNSKYDVIVADLRARIATGEFAPGDRLPSTRALAAQWGVVRNTAGRAVNELVHLGLVEVHHGKGAYVTGEDAVANVDRGALRRRLEANMRWLVDEGHMTPLAQHQIRAVLDAEGVTGVPDSQLRP